MNIRIFLLTGLLIAGFILPSLAEQYNTPPIRKVTVVGTATIKVIPDEMLWTVQVTINDSTLAKAKARHDASLGDELKFS